MRTSFFFLLFAFYLSIRVRSNGGGYHEFAILLSGKWYEMNGVTVWRAYHKQHFLGVYSFYDVIWHLLDYDIEILWGACATCAQYGCYDRDPHPFPHYPHVWPHLTSHFIYNLEQFQVFLVYITTTKPITLYLLSREAWHYSLLLLNCFLAENGLFHIMRCRLPAKLVHNALT